MGAVVLLIALLFMMGAVYPLCAVLLHKLSGSKKTLMQILAEL